MTRRLISETAERAVKRSSDFQACKPPAPIELKIEYHDSNRAAEISLKKDVIRMDGRTVLYPSKNVLEAYHALIY